MTATPATTQAADDAFAALCRIKDAARKIAPEVRSGPGHAELLELHSALATAFAIVGPITSGQLCAFCGYPRSGRHAASCLAREIDEDESFAEELVAAARLAPVAEAVQGDWHDYADSLARLHAELAAERLGINDPEPVGEGRS